MTYQTLPSIDKGSAHGEVTSQPSLLACCLLPLQQQQMRDPEHHTGKVLLAYAHMQLTDTVGKSRARAKLAAAVETGVKPEVKELKLPSNT